MHLGYLGQRTYKLLDRFSNAFGLRNDNPSAMKNAVSGEFLVVELSSLKLLERGHCQAVELGSV